MPSSLLSTHLPSLRRVAAVVLLFTAGLAQAQFVWVDPKGVRHYSDQPPPPGTPPGRILKAPGLPAMSVQPPSSPTPATPAAKAALPTAPAVPAAPDAPATPAVAAKGAARGPQTLAEKEADFRKRLKEGQEAEQKAQQQARTDALKTEYCNEVRRAKQMYDSGIRIADIGADGQKRYLTDAERAAHSARANTMAADCR